MFVRWRALQASLPLSLRPFFVGTAGVAASSTAAAVAAAFGELRAAAMREWPLPGEPPAF